MSRFLLRVLPAMLLVAVSGFICGCEGDDDNAQNITITDLEGRYELVDMTIITAAGETHDAGYLQLQGGYLIVNPDSTYRETHQTMGSTQYGSGSMAFNGGNSMTLTATPSGRIIPAQAEIGAETTAITKWPDNGETHIMVWQAL